MPKKQAVAANIGDKIEIIVGTVVFDIQVTTNIVGRPDLKVISKNLEKPVFERE